jgi:ligand-binding sensor domain-containing protein
MRPGNSPRTGTGPIGARTRTFSLAGICLVLACWGFSQPLYGQSGIEGWQAHTSYRSVTGISDDGTAIWAATSGGVFGFDVATGTITRYSVVDGLFGVETQTIAADPARGVVWIGYGSGVLDRLDPATGVITTFRDIQRASQFSSRGINRVAVRGDTLLISTDFGIVVFDPLRTEVRDAYTRLGGFSPAIAVNDVVVAPGENGESRLWAATDEGLASAPLGAANLQDPAAWETESAGLVTSRDDATAVDWFGGELYVGTTTDLYVRGPGGVFTRKFVSSSGISSLEATPTALFGSERFNLFEISSAGVVQILQMPGFQDPTQIIQRAGGGLWVGDREGGLLSIDAPAPGVGSVTVSRTIVPDGPSESQFSDLAFGPDGTLWAGGSIETEAGFHRLSVDGKWTAFSGANEPLLAGTSRYTRIAADQLGNGWAGSEGGGVVRVDPDGTLQVFGPANSSLRPAPGTTDFVIVGGLGADSDANLWVTTRAAATPLHVRTEAGEWTGFDAYIGDGLTPSATAYGRILSDSFDQKWIIVRSENNFNIVRGLLVVDTGQSITDQSDDRFQFFDEPGAAGLGLPSIGVTSVVEDRDGLLWVGTSSGLAYFINTGVVASDASARAIWPQWADRRRGVFVLFGLQVNDLAVDPANRLWVATNEGAWLIEAVEGGYELVSQFSADNSPLFSDEVLSVAVDPKSGLVFFATDRGLLTFEGDAIAPSGESGDLFVYPNPVTDADSDVFIEGLVESAQVRIVTPNGSLVASLATRGGRARWDGRDRNGSLVPSGVYLVIAVGDSGQGTSYGRVAVIR